MKSYRFVRQNPAKPNALPLPPSLDSVSSCFSRWRFCLFERWKERLRSEQVHGNLACEITDLMRQSSLGA
ncbi:hypothetical protein BHE74_00049838 [Ensete ventricosum]|nr:hypothetical protein BHE74_00049838 [Ensete ventricosum]